MRFVWKTTLSRERKLSNLCSTKYKVRKFERCFSELTLTSKEFFTVKERKQRFTRKKSIFFPNFSLWRGTKKPNEDEEEFSSFLS